MENIIKTRTTIVAGSGEFDKIGITRIRKRCGCSKAAVVMLPGSNSDFETSFLSMAVYLAGQNIDVWGIDFRYSSVPEYSDSTPYCQAKSCEFMKNWTTDTYLSDLDTVVKIAALSSQDEKVFLLGWSQGAFFAYRYAGDHPDLKGVVALDIAYNLDPALADIIAKTKAELLARSEKINQGIYYEDVLTEKYIAYLASTDPNGSSPVIEGLTNRQAFLFAITAAYQLPAFSLPNYRYAQGDLNGLKYTDYDFILQQAFKLNSFQSIYPTTDLYSQWVEPLPSIPDIHVPVMHVGAEYGFGAFGLYTLEKIKEFNSDVTACLIKDYGHADLVWANAAKHDVWNGITRWLINRMCD